MVSGRPGILVRAQAVAEMDPVTLYRILALRSGVFVVEQDCAYQDPDGRDIEPGAVLFWAERDGDVLATLRVLDEPDGTVRIGRVATSEAARGQGLAAVLLNRAMALSPGRDVVLGAQAYLVDWYARLGFVPDGPEYTEDGIPHVPMRRRATPPAR